jgi:hypothetical protein
MKVKVVQQNRPAKYSDEGGPIYLKRTSMELRENTEDEIVFWDVMPCSPVKAN